jgi:hypothetical protein
VVSPIFIHRLIFSLVPISILLGNSGCQPICIAAADGSILSVSRNSFSALRVRTFSTAPQNGRRRVSRNNVQRRKKGIQVRFDSDDVSSKSAPSESPVPNSFFDRRTSNPAIRRRLRNAKCTLFSCEVGLRCLVLLCFVPHFQYILDLAESKDKSYNPYVLRRQGNPLCPGRRKWKPFPD